MRCEVCLPVVLRTDYWLCKAGQHAITSATNQALRAGVPAAGGAPRLHRAAATCTCRVALHSGVLVCSATRAVAATAAQLRYTVHHTFLMTRCALCTTFSALQLKHCCSVPTGHRPTARPAGLSPHHPHQLPASRHNRRRGLLWCQSHQRHQEPRLGHLNQVGSSSGSRHSSCMGWH